jgi:hypothetical protein
VGERSLAFILIGSIVRRISTERHHRQCEQESLVGGIEKEPLVSGVAAINTVYEDPIVYPTSPLLIVDLGARSIVSGVDCNDPEKSPILELIVIFFFTSS